MGTAARGDQGTYRTDSQWGLLGVAKSPREGWGWAICLQCGQHRHQVGRRQRQAFLHLSFL